MSQKINAKELIEKMAAEIGRLQKLCAANGIDYKPPQSPQASISVTASVKVIDSKT